MKKYTCLHDYINSGTHLTNNEFIYCLREQYHLSIVLHSCEIYGNGKNKLKAIKV